MQHSFAEIEAFVERFYRNAFPDNRSPRFTLVPYDISTTFAALAQNAVANNVVTITGNADFVLLGLHHRAQIGGAQTSATKTTPFVRCLISDSGSGENFSQTAVDLEACSTNGNFENSLFYPRVLAGKSTLNVQVTNDF